MNVFQVFLIVFFGAAFIGFVYSFVEMLRLIISERRIAKEDEALTLKTAE